MNSTNSSATACRSPAIAAAEGTPLYVYSAATLRERYRAIDAAFGGYPHALHYALKANSTLAIARLLRELGSAVDANSIWEIEVARKAGFPARRRSSSPASASRPRSSSAPSRSGVKAINVESAGELARVEAIAVAAGTRRRASPSASTRTSTRRAIRTSRPASRSTSSACRSTMRASCWRRCAARPSLTLVAIHVHVGSQITTLEPLRRAAALAARRQPRAAATPASASSTSTSAAASASPTTAARCRRRREYVARAGRRGAARRACRSSSSRAARSRRRRACSLARVIDLKPRTGD